MDADSFESSIKTGDFIEDISDDVDNWLEISDYNLKRSLSLGKKKTKKVTGLMKVERSVKIKKTWSKFTKNISL